MRNGQQEISGWRRDVDRVVVGGIEGFLSWFAHNWLLLICISTALLVSVSLLVPYLMSIGHSWLAVPVFQAYRVLCTQIPEHSYWPFGYQMALCQRDLAIFASFLAGSLAFWATGRTWKPLHWRWYVVMLVPIAIDGFTQLAGLRHSTWELRTVTGGLFGVANVLMILPRLEWAMNDVLQSVRKPSAGERRASEASPDGKLVPPQEQPR